MSIELPEKWTLPLHSKSSIPTIANVEILLEQGDIPNKAYERLRSSYYYEVKILVITARANSCYSLKITSLLRNKENNERSSEKFRFIENINHEENYLLSYKTGYECEIINLTQKGLTMEFEVTVIPQC